MVVGVLGLPVVRLVTNPFMRQAIDQLAVART